MGQRFFKFVHDHPGIDTAVAALLLVSFCLTLLFGQSPYPQYGDATPVVQQAASETGEPLEAPPVSVQRVLMPFDVAKIAFADASRFNAIDAPFLRYIYINGEPDRYIPSVNVTVNMALSKAALIQYPAIIHPNLVRYDLRLLAPQADDLEDLIETYEELSFDPYWHEFLQILDNLDSEREAAIEALTAFFAVFEGNDETQTQWAEFIQIEALRKELSRRRLPNLVILRRVVDQLKAQTKGRSPVFDEAVANLVDALERLIQEVDNVDEIEVRGRRSAAGALANNEEIVIPARHAGEAFELLSTLLQSDAAIVRADHFMHRVLSSIDNGYGAGLYFDFRGIESEVAGVTLRQRDGNNQTDFEAVLATYGADLEEIADLRSDQAAALFVSGVTGKCRKAIFVYGTGVRPSAGTGLIVYTQDPDDAQVDAENDPIRNLIAFEFAAQELIAELPNGYHEYSLFNAAGALQLSAPDNVVVDHTVPAPYTTRLHCAMSCIRCHAPQHGHMHVDNDVTKLTKAGTDILDDLASADGLDDLIDRLVGQYEGNLEKPLQRSRDDLGEAVYRSTAFYDRTKVGWSVPKAFNTLAQIYAEYSYTPITPVIALHELGYKVTDPARAVRLLRQVTPVVRNDAEVLLIDPALAALRAGIPIKRSAWEGVYFDAALRALLTAKGLQDQVPKPNVNWTPRGQR